MHSLCGYQKPFRNIETGKKALELWLSGNDLSLAAVTLFSAFCSLLLSKSSFLVLLKGWCDHLGFKGKTGLRNPAKKTPPATQKEALVEAPQNKVPGKARKQDTPEDDDNDNVPPEEAAKEPIVKAVKTVPVNEAVSDMMTTATFLGNLIDKEEGRILTKQKIVTVGDLMKCSQSDLQSIGIALGTAKTIVQRVAGLQKKGI